MLKKTFTDKLVSSEVIQLAHAYNPSSIIFEYLREPTEAFYQAIKIKNKGKKLRKIEKTNYIIAEILNKISLSDKNAKGQKLLLEELKEAKSVLDCQIEAIEIDLSTKFTQEEK